MKNMKKAPTRLLVIVAISCFCAVVMGTETGIFLFLLLALAQCIAALI